MDQPEIPIHPALATSESTNLEAEVRSLRTITSGLLVALLCIGAGVALSLYRQVTILNVQVTDAKRVIADYQTNALPRIRWFVGSLQNFARTNSDFNPILAKYNLLATNAAPPPSAAAPAIRK